MSPSGSSAAGEVAGLEAQHRREMVQRGYRDVHDGVSPARSGHTHLVDERDDAHGYAGTFSCTTHPSPLSRLNSALNVERSGEAATSPSASFAPPDIRVASGDAAARTTR